MCILVLLLGLTFPALSQNISISGTVKDAQGEPLMGVVVTDDNGKSVGILSSVSVNHATGPRWSRCRSAAHCDTATVLPNPDGAATITARPALRCSSRAPMTARRRSIPGLDAGVVARNHGTGCIPAVPDDCTVNP